ncbi:MAG: hypothetical protein KGD73_02475 [Candidatus Lokiarchaeota archaeon]|nr:hypothetical protein [Candidatus Lokiarchaeota archaeon]
MALFDINSIIVLITFVIIFAVFLAFDLFQRNEKYAYLVYIVALLPVNFMWLINFDILGVYLLLFILWCASLIRDLWGVKKDKKEINDILMYLALAILVQLILTAVLPVSIPTLLTNTTPWFVFNLPDIYTEAFTPETWVNLELLLAFRLTATIMIILVIIPLILDIKDEEVPLPMFIIIIALFILPFLYLSHLWLPQATAVLTLLMSVMLFIVLLLITRSGKEELQQKK